jgi:class 3 adenylate cyclase
VDAPEVRYAKSGDANIAYGVVGDGPFDLVFVSGWVLSTLDRAWEGPPAEFFRRLASFSRLILFDKRGTGLSDRVAGLPDLETRMDDVRAVMDSVGSKRAAILGASEGGPMSLMFAAAHPERIAAAVIYGTRASWLRSDDYPWSDTADEYRRAVDERERRVGSPEYLDELLKGFSPTLAGDPTMRSWWRRWVRASASPAAIGALARMNQGIDVRQVLPVIRVPTLVLHRVDDDSFVCAEGRYIADRIPGAQFLELPGRDHGWWAHPEQITIEAERFLKGVWQRGEWDVVDTTDRVLATVLFTDIVGSTAKVVELGDRQWRQLLEQHHTLVRRQIARFRGREINTAGDAFFAAFDGPARAIRCACAIADQVKELGIEVRAGLHSGECEVVDGQMGGIAVHIGARVAARAAPGEVLVSNTVKDLVAGSGLQFVDRGAATLAGVPGDWHLFAVDRTPAEVPTSWRSIVLGPDG